MDDREGTNEPGGADEIAAAHDALAARQDEMSELGETESMRLQMAMDRRAKAQQTLSNVLEKQSDAAEAIIDNLK